jgi:hypothetical protein
MAPNYARTIIKRHLTRIINLAKAYKTTDMTLEGFIKVKKLEKKLDGFHKTYEIFSKRIQDEMYKEGVDQATIDADFNTMIQTMDEVIFAKIIFIKNKRREWLNKLKDENQEEESDEEEWEKDREKTILNFFQQQAATHAQLTRDIISQVIAAISTAYSVPFAPGDVYLSPAASQTNPVVELIPTTLATSQFAAVSVPNPIPPVVSSLTTESCSFPHTPSYQSKENFQTEEKEAGTASLPHPPKKGDPLSDSLPLSDGPDGYPDKKRFERNEIKENNSFGYKLENSAKLDGAEKITSSTAKSCYSDQNVKSAQSKEVPMEKEPGTASLQQRPKKDYQSQIFRSNPVETKTKKGLKKTS